MSLGPLIQEIFEETQMKVSVFATRIGMSRQSVYNMFEKETLETDLLMRVSQALNYDFFKHYQFERETDKMRFVPFPDPIYLRPDARLKDTLWKLARAQSRIDQLEIRLADKEKLIELLRKDSEENLD